MDCNNCNGKGYHKLNEEESLQQLKDLGIEDCKWTKNSQARSICDECHGFGNREKEVEYDTLLRDIIAQKIIEATFDPRLAELNHFVCYFNCPIFLKDSSCEECKTAIEAADAVMRILNA